jgi:mannose-6-phosphate isomerase class I
MLKAAAAAWPGEATGVLALLLLEDVVLGPGEAALIPSGCPHAYVCGGAFCYAPAF